MRATRLTLGLGLATALSLSLAFLASCTGHPSFKDATLSDRQFQLEEFFDGNFHHTIEPLGIADIMEGRDG